MSDGNSCVDDRRGSSSIIFINHNGLRWRRAAEDVMETEDLLIKQAAEKAAQGQ
jgi:hypothetical protein